VSVTLDGRDLRVHGVFAIMWLTKDSIVPRVGTVEGRTYIYSTVESARDHSAVVIEVSSHAHDRTRRTFTLFTNPNISHKHTLLYRFVRVLFCITEEG
jgi:hypothetical protein